MSERSRETLETLVRYLVAVTSPSHKSQDAAPREPPSHPPRPFRHRLTQRQRLALWWASVKDILDRARA